MTEKITNTNGFIKVYNMTFGYPDFAANLTETKNLYAKSYRVSIRIADIHSVQYAKTFVKFIH